MLSCHNLWLLLGAVLVLEIHQSCAIPHAADELTEEANVADVSKLGLITDSVIHDEIEKGTKKVIRVNPLDLPPLKQDPNVVNMDSSLYKIQTLKTKYGNKKYKNIQRSKPLNKEDHKAALSDSTIIRGLSLAATPDKILKPKHQPKNKKLHFLYNQEDLAGNLLSKSMPVRVAPGAYPVYYVVAKTNGRFGKYPLKSFDNPRAFAKYLQKSKLEKLPVLETFDQGV